MTINEKLSAIIEECRLNAYRILIEVEPSMSLYFWCDKNEKRHIVRMIRRNQVKLKINWNLTDDKTNYVKDQDLVYLEKDKEKIITTF